MVHGIGFHNLEAELARRGITYKQLAQDLRISAKSVERKLNSIAILKYSEMRAIQKLIMDMPVPDSPPPESMTLDYLFAQIKDTA